MINAKKQNEISHIYLQSSDLNTRKQQVLLDASNKLKFIPSKFKSESTWWGSSEIGAFTVTGFYNNAPAVLKIQGVKPTTNEAFMIKQFEKTNKSKLVRPPYIYAHLPWDQILKYEALILEPVDKKVLQTPATKDQLSIFFSAYKEYKLNCAQKPWLNKPKESLSQRVANNFFIWQKAAIKRFPTHPFRHEGDKRLIEKAVEVLIKGYKDVSFEFMHGHFSEKDLYFVNDQYVLLSNLYWGYKAPLYDAVFGIHWFMLHLSDVMGITSEKIEEQRCLWFSEIESLPQVKANERLYHLALLERATAGLNLDALSIDFKLPIAEYLTETTRKQVENLLKSAP